MLKNHFIKCITYITLQGNQIRQDVTNAICALEIETLVHML